MIIYIGHSRSYDYENELYKTIRNDEELKKYNIILPHENENDGKNTREFYNLIDLFICEGSYAATGLGIELGWAYDSKVPIFCIYKSGQKVSGSIYAVTDKVYEYKTVDEMIMIIKDIISKNI